MNEGVLTLEEWIIENEALDLREEIDTHISALTDLNEDDAQDLSRMIMISIRQHVNLGIFNE